MSDQLGNLTKSVGHGSNTQEVHQDIRGNFERAGSGSPVTNWGFIAQLQAEADEMETQIEEMLEKFPEEAVKSKIGIFVLEGYAKHGILEGVTSDYPYRFSAADLIKDGMCIIAQLVAEEYYEEGPEACPFHPMAFDNWDFEKNHKRPQEWEDPFSTFKRPDVTIEYVEKMERTNFDPSKPVSDKPDLIEWK